MFALSLLLAPAAEACPSLDAQLERATLAVIAGDTSNIDAALADARASFGCAVAGRRELARYFLVRGVVAGGNGEEPAAWFAASRLLAPDGFDPRFGSAFHEAFLAARPGGAATVTLEPALSASLDGDPVVDWPAPVHSGPHLVQVLDPARQVLFSREFTLAPEENTLVLTGLAPDATAAPATAPLQTAAPLPTVAPPPVDAATIPPKRGARRTALLVASAAAAVAGGALAYGATAQNPILESTTDLDAFEGARTRQQIFGWSAYGLGGAALIGGTLSFVLP